MPRFPQTVQFTIPVPAYDDAAHALQDYDFCSSPAQHLVVPSLSDLSSEGHRLCIPGDADHGFSTFPVPTLAANTSSTSPRPISKPKQAPSRRRNPSQPPRPRNAFMIYRSEIWAKEKITKGVEHDHRHISRIIGHCWNQMPEEDKNVWRRRAAQEKLEHERKYPGYRFMPSTRTKKPIKRKVKRNSEEELDRCKRVATLMLSGKTGDELERAVNRSCPLPMQAEMSGRGAIPQQGFYSFRCEAPAPFRSPLRRPSRSDDSPPELAWSPESSTDSGRSNSPETPVELAPGSIIFENPGGHSGLSASLTPPSPVSPIQFPPTPLEDQASSPQLHTTWDEPMGVAPEPSETPTVQPPSNMVPMMNAEVPSECSGFQVVAQPISNDDLSPETFAFAFPHTFQPLGIENPFCAPLPMIPTSVKAYFQNINQNAEGFYDQQLLQPFYGEPPMGPLDGINVYNHPYSGHPQPEVQMPQDFLVFHAPTPESLVGGVQWDVLGFPVQTQVHQ
ncbi:hypothetical protein BDN72DRAFT_829825 [Pluteus cervinus]|uniref:Uncharacterized protein n=1 Tax=Pluteus cervinus TaxID=181527 RepID=A0ACD3BEQ2_9AGAR|nr:hypothetical protein BDN72DRAFT_829825 [Pluteus cervinus]